jgi:hypothetical protein
MQRTKEMTMNKEEWITAAAAKLEPYEGTNSREYAESLYQTYVEDDGDHWRMTIGEERASRCVQFDPDAWKSFLYGAITTPPGGANGVFLYGKAASAHEMIGHHLAAEYAQSVTIRGTTFDKWQKRPENPDNHLLDCVVGAAVAASVQGLAWQAGALAGQVPASVATPPKRDPNAPRRHITPGAKHITRGSAA